MMSQFKLPARRPTASQILAARLALNLNKPAMLHQATSLFLRSTAGLLSTYRSRQEQSAPAISVVC